MKKIAHLLMGRLTIVGVSILLQICWLFLVLWKFSYQFTYANLIIRAAAIVLVLVIANKWENPANKLSWTFLILLSPILGIMLYFLFGRSGLTKHTREQMDAVNREVDACMPVDEEAVRLLQEADPSVLRQSKYIADWGHFPVYRNTAHCAEHNTKRPYKPLFFHHEPRLASYCSIKEFSDKQIPICCMWSRTKDIFIIIGDSYFRFPSK